MILLAAASFCELALLLRLHRKNLDDFSVNALAVILGTPLTPAYQNRLLGPALAWALSRLFGHFEAWFYLLFCVFWTVANAAMYLLMCRLTRSEARARPAAASLILLTLILLGQQGTVFYLWDPLDAIFFTVFAYGVFARWGWKRFTMLFFVELLNREAAIFMALWLMLDSLAVSRTATGKSLSVNKPGQLGLGLMLALFGVIWVRLVRNALFKHYLVPNTKIPPLVLGNHWLPFINLQVLGDSLEHPSVIGLVSLSILPALALFVFAHRSRITPCSSKALVLIGLMTVSNFCFANATELRTWIDLVPLLIMFHFSDEGRQKAQAA